jgi:transcription antitermination factor NusG
LIATTETLACSPPAAPADLGQWHALWTQSHCERLVHDQLVQKDFRPFLPHVHTWSRRGGVRRLIRVPMFSGYLFLRHVMDKRAYLEVRQARGLVRVLGDRWDRLAVIPDDEMNAIGKVAASERPVFVHPYLREGQRVRITRGPLVGVEGILLETKPVKGLLVVSVHLLQRSVAVVVDATEAVPS